MPRRKEPRIPDAVLDQLLAGADPKTVFDPNGLIDDLKKALAERVLNAEIDHHLAGEEQGNRRNGYGKKTVITDIGHIELEVPRDRQARFDPQLIAKYQRRFAGFDDKIISMYARGMSARDRRSFARSLRHRGFARFDQRGHRRGAGGGFPLASPPVGSSLSADFLRRAAGQDPRRHRQLVASGQLNLGGRQWIENLLPTHTADFSPDLEFLGPGSSDLRGSDMIAAEMEEVVDLIVGGEKALRLAGRFELLHLPLSSARR